MNLEHEIVVGGGGSGGGDLDPIPEDVSVSIENGHNLNIPASFEGGGGVCGSIPFSTTAVEGSRLSSSVVSTSSTDAIIWRESGDDHYSSNKNNKLNDISKERKRSRRRRSEEKVDSSGGRGTDVMAVVDLDNVSDANASLGVEPDDGDEESQREKQNQQKKHLQINHNQRNSSSVRSKQPTKITGAKIINDGTNDNRQRHDQRKQHKMGIVFWTTTLILIVAIVIGIYFIVKKTCVYENNKVEGGAEDHESMTNISSPSVASLPPRDSNTNNNVAFPDMIPDLNDDMVTNFDQQDFPIETSMPSPLLASSLYTEDEIAMLDDAFLKVHGTDESNLYDESTPEGKGRLWMIHRDQIKLFDNSYNEDFYNDFNTTIDEQRVQQRYILAVFYYGTGGKYWKTKRWLNTETSECDWIGINCTDITLHNTNKADEDRVVDHEGDKIDSKDAASGSNSNKKLVVTDINLRDQNITGQMQKQILSLSHLKVLNLTNNSISGSIPADFFDYMKQLISLKVEGNLLSGTIPPAKLIETTTASKLQTLKVGSNKLTGDVPFFPNLKKLWVFENNLNSLDFRYTLSNASTQSPLIEIRAYNNSMSGPLPIDWHGLPNLTKLDLGINQLSGTIPSSIWNDLPALKRLYLDQNKLSGKLPTSSQTTNLEHVWLDTNVLTGSVPDNFGWNWTNLHELQLHNNLFNEGAIKMDQCNRWKKPEGTEDFSFLVEDYNCTASADDADGSDSINGGISSEDEDQQQQEYDWKMNVDCNISCDCCNSNCTCIGSNGHVVQNDDDSNSKNRRRRS